jgi:hypothetical protein
LRTRSRRCAAERSGYLPGDTLTNHARHAVGHLIAQVAAPQRGGPVVCAGIRMSNVPSFHYCLLWGERSVRWSPT